MSVKRQVTYVFKLLEHQRLPFRDGLFRMFKDTHHISVAGTLPFVLKPTQLHAITLVDHGDGLKDTALIQMAVEEQYIASIPGYIHWFEVLNDIYSIPLVHPALIQLGQIESK